MTEAAGDLLALALVLAPLPLTIPIAVIDLRRQIIPDGLNLALLATGLAMTAWHDPEAFGLGLRCAEAALAFGFGWSVRALHARLRGRVGLGLGDVKFLAAATAWTGLAQLPLMILVASLAALLALGLFALSGRRVGAATRLPFGPFLVLGLHVVLALGPVTTG